MKAKQKANSSAIRANMASIAGMTNEITIVSMLNAVYAANNYRSHDVAPKN